jgi:hypothetical protein
MSAENHKMSPEEFRRAMYKYWDEINEEAKYFKDPYLTLVRLRSLFSKFDVTSEA